MKTIILEQNLYKILLTMSSFLSISYENKKYSIFHLFSQFSKDNIISFDNIFHIKIQFKKKIYIDLIVEDKIIHITILLL
ncbi:hypothetical protein PFAG_03051 [Plasmodium falciparum Santa Lucia]|uniref:Uncharacterized protein n=1 Tax=Plasmodium falciparum Santa Lucia TaxID=478859 RepID=W7FHX8_PLAFA|nr:hypothetical protein PFAG_03051 [Plasmodium falciparum Santa Lucia]